MNESMTIKVLSTLTEKKFDLVKIIIPPYSKSNKGILTQDLNVKAIFTFNDKMIFEGDLLNKPFEYLIDKDNIKISIGKTTFFIANDVDSGNLILKIKELRLLRQKIISNKKSKRIAIIVGLLIVFMIVFKIVNTTQNVASNDKEKIITDTKVKVIKQTKFPKYVTVMEMIKASSDYKDNCVEMLSKKGESVHIRVSYQFINTESKKNMIEQVKRDIVYIVYQTFAETDLDKITVTSIPIVRKTFNPNSKDKGNFQNSLKQTVTITKKKATKILEKYINTTSYEDLYQLYEKVLYIPNEKFDILTITKVNQVFSDFKK